MGSTPFLSCLASAHTVCASISNHTMTGPVIYFNICLLRVLFSVAKVEGTSNIYNSKK